METLILSRSEILSLLDMAEIMDAVHEALREKATGRVQMPPKTYLYYEKYRGDLRVMPSYLEALESTAVKIVNVHPDNRKYGLPTVMATIVLLDPKTGFPMAIMDGTAITAMRTGAASAIATKFLARKNSETLGIIGAGAQART